MRITCSTSKEFEQEYYRSLAKGVVRKYNEAFANSDLEYDISEDTLSFADNGDVIFVQLLSDITPVKDDLTNDISDLADAVIESRGKNNKSDEVVLR
jgi:hypothetical protein